MTIEKERELVASLRETLAKCETRLVLSNSFIAFLNLAFDAKCHHDIDYRELRVYKEEDNPLFDQTPRTEADAKDILIRWLSRITNDLNGAVKRKGMKKIK